MLESLPSDFKGFFVLPGRQTWEIFFVVTCVIGLLCLVGCRKKKLASINAPGEIAILKPYLKNEKRIRNRLPLHLKLFDSDGVRSLDVVIKGRTVWRKTFATQGQGEASVRTVLTNEKMELDDGVQSILFRLRDQKGQDSFRKLKVFVDKTGPVIDWLIPKPQSRIATIAKAELRVTDLSRVQKVEVFHNNRLVKRMVYAPYLFPLDPGEFSSGVVMFRVEATDGLGNRSRRSFSFEVAGSAEGSRCSKADSCKAPFVCVKRVGASRGVCRRRCRSNRDCPSGLRCRRAKRLKVCLPDLRRKRKLRALGGRGVGLMKRCSAMVLCRRGLLCVSLDRKESRCLAICGPGRPLCPERYRCSKVAGKSQRVCAPLRKFKRKRIGQRCSRNECVRNAVCLIKGGSKYGICYKKCTSNYECQSPKTCERLPGKSLRICYRMPHKTVGPYEFCSKRNKCRYGLQCISAKNSPRPRCFHTCSGGCGSGSVCVRAGAYAVCLRKCNPNSANCPGGTSCGLTLFGKKSAYLCR